MPKIVIKSKGLVKAQYMNSSIGPGPTYSGGPFAPSFMPTTTTTTAPPIPFAGAQPSTPSNLDPFSSNFSASDWAKNLYMQTPPSKPQKPSWAQRTQQNLGRFYGALDNINTALGLSDANKKFRQGQRFMRQNQLPDNIYAVGQQSAADTEGDYNINTGMFGKQGSYTVNKGQAINNTNFLPERVFYNRAQVGGENTSMKIRITRTPDQDVMAYGGQARHSLDLRRDALLTPNIEYEDDYEVNDTLKPVPREDANIEAEKDETAFGDFDGDGNFEHMKIGGKRHHEGGTPLNLPEGTFIFSDTAKMRIKDEEVLSYFSLKPKKGGYTPAEIAKKYDVNKYKGLIDDPEADSISKTTAEQMIKNYNKKLAYLALIQESMKGFPQGVPEVCKKILGIEDNTEEQGMQASPEDEEAMSAEMMQQPQQEGMEEEMPQEEMPEQGVARYGTSIKQLRKYQGTGPSEVASDPNYQFKARTPGRLDYSNPNYAGGIWSGGRYQSEWIPMVQQSLADSASAARVMQNLEKYTGPDAADVQAIVKTAKASANPYATLQRLATDRKVGPFHRAVLMSMQTTSTTTQPPQTTSTTTQPGTSLIPPGKLGETTPLKAINQGPLWPDVQAMYAASAVPPRNYQIAVKSPPSTNERVFLNDPRQALAENQSLLNAAAANIGAMGDVRTANAVTANLQGEGLKGATGIVGDVQDKNVDRMSAWAARDRAYQDQYNKEASDLATQRGFVARDTDVFNKNQWRKYINNVTASKINMWNNKMKMNLLNSVNQNYNIDPWTGNLTFKPGYGVENLRARGSQYSYPSAEHFQQLQSKFPALTQQEYLSPGMASTFRQEDKSADPYAAYYNFYNPIVSSE